MARLPLPAALVCSLAILAAIPALAAEPEKPKTPEKAELSPEVRQAQELFESLYGEQLRRLAPRDTAGQVAMAAKLLEAAKAAQDQPALLVLICEKACELGAADPKGYETGVAAADILASNLPDKAAGCQERVAMIRQRQYEKARGEERAKAYSERYLALHAERDISRTKAELGVKQIEDDLKHLGGEAWAPPNETFGPGHWIDILKLVDPNMDTTLTWERRGDTLVSSGGGVVAFPVVPAGNYEVELKFVHGDGDIRIWPPLGTGRAYLTLPGEGKGVRCGMDGAKGGWYVSNETTVKGPDLERDRAHTVLLQVQLSGDKAAFGVTIDGTSLIKWTGAQSALHLPPPLVPPPKEKCVCLAKPGGGNIVVQGVRLRMLTGRANPLRPPAPTPAATAPGAAGESPAPARPETK